MKNEYKKLFFLIFLILVFFFIVLIWQIKKNASLETKFSDRPLIEEGSVDIPASKEDLILGNRGAAVTITEFIDLNNKENLSLHQKIKDFVVLHPKEIRLIWKDFPAQSFFGKDVNKTHRAAICIAEQNQENFWLFIDELSEIKKINETKLLALGEKYAANQTAWKDCTTKQTTEDKILNSISFINSVGVRKSPALFINNRLVNYVDEIDITDLLEQIITAKTEN